MSSECTSLSPECPLEDTVYGYYPNLGANAFFVAAFGLCAVLQLFFGIRYKTWTWLLACGVGTTFEAVGYAGRIAMHFNPWSDPGFKTQIVCLIVSPSFILAGINLTLKHFVLTFGREHSMLKPALYTWLFISTDAVSLIAQAAGGGVSSAAETQELLDVGRDLIVAGVAIQIFQLSLFGLMTLWYLWRLSKGTGSIDRLPVKAQNYFASTKFRGFVAAIIIAYFTTLTRCIYRLPEMAGGWGNELMRREGEFLGLDGGMILAASIVITIFHPGFCFPELSKGTSVKQELKDVSHLESGNAESTKEAHNLKYVDHLGSDDTRVGAMEEKKANGVDELGEYRA